MSEWPLACPAEDVLLGFAEGRLAGAVQAEVIQHLSACDVCLAAVGGVGRAGALSEDLATVATAFQAGDLVAGRYSIRRFIARGGMGEVYEAADQLLGVRVALKTVVFEAANSARGIEQIRREVQLARAINHPGVCRVFDLGEDTVEGPDGRNVRRFFLTMEFLEGQTLGQCIRTEGRQDDSVLFPLARQLAEGLVAAHDAGVVHRDFKSDNVMLLVPDSGGWTRAVVMDFGLARGGPSRAGIASSAAGVLVGSCAYMAPEQVAGGAVGQAADIYAFGVVLFETATGRLPFSAPTALATAAKRLFEDPPAPRTLTPTISPGLEEVILRCMAREPGDRFVSMRDVSRALQGLAVPASSGAAPLGRGDAPAAPSRRLLPWALAAGAMAIAAVAVLVSAEGGGATRFTENGHAAAPVRPGGSGSGTASAAPAQMSSGAPSPPDTGRPARAPTNATTLASSDSASVSVSPRPVERSRTTAARAAPEGGGLAPRRGGATGTTAPRTRTVQGLGGRELAGPSDLVPAPQTEDDVAQKKPRSRSPLDGFGDPFQ